MGRGGTAHAVMGQDGAAHAEMGRDEAGPRVGEGKAVTQWEVRSA